MPPWPGTAMLSSANTSAPSTASTPPMLQAAITSPGVSTCFATLCGVKKMPTPMMPPTTTQPMSKALRRGGGSGAIEMLGEIHQFGVEGEVGAESKHAFPVAVQHVQAAVLVAGERRRLLGAFEQCLRHPLA